MAEKLCQRCGIQWEVEPTRKVNDLCVSCRARKTQKVRDCLPWHGRYANDMLTPVHEDGSPVMPGKRICGNSDCVNTNHLERA